MPKGLFNVSGPIWGRLLDWHEAKPGRESEAHVKAIEAAITKLMNDHAKAAARLNAPAPRKMEIPPSPADALDVVFAEGWNQCCDAYFGGLPPQEPLVVTVFKTNSDTAEAAPQPTKEANDVHT